MSFSWLDDDEVAVGGDDDDDNNEAYGGVKTARQKKANNNESVYVCPNCGSTESYYDDASGLRVCQDCYTTHLSSQQETTEYEELTQFAARGRNGKFKGVVSDGTGKKGRKRRDLHDFDIHSSPLPELTLCLKAMQKVLMACTKILCRDIMPHLPHHLQQPSVDVLLSPSPPLTTEDDDDDDDQNKDFDILAPDHRRLRQTVRDLWQSYLRSWADGAQYYGTIYPHARFCLRDAFLSCVHQDLLGKVLAEQQQQKHAAAAATTTTPATAAPALISSEAQQSSGEKQDDLHGKQREKRRVSFNVPQKRKDVEKEKNHCSDIKDEIEDNDDNDDDENDGTENSEEEDTEEEDDNDAMANSHGETTSTAAAAASEYSARVVATKKRYGAMTHYGFLRRLLDRYRREQQQKQHHASFSFDAPTAALLLRPDLHLVAGLLLLALLAHNVIIPTFEFLRWIESGTLPLKTAFDDLLPSSSSSSSSSPYGGVSLRQQLKLVAPHFRQFRPIAPGKLDRTVTALAIACRIKPHAYEYCVRRRKYFSFRAHQFVFWNGPRTLALRLAQLAAAAGLPRAVLDRAMLLVGLPPTANASASASSSSSPSSSNKDDSGSSSSSDDNDDDDDDDSSTNSSSTHGSGSRDDRHRSTTTTTKTPTDDPAMKQAGTLPAAGKTKPTTVRHEETSFDFMAPNTIPAIPQLAHAQDVATPEDILALLAIACQFDPDWRQWRYFRCTPSTQQRQYYVMPHNESELLNMDHPDRYLQHCYEKVFVDVADTFTPKELILPLPKDLFNESGSSGKGGDDESARGVGMSLVKHDEDSFGVVGRKRKRENAEVGSAPSPRASRRKRARGNTTVADGPKRDDRLTRSLDEDSSRDNDDEKEEVWGIRSLKPAMLLKPNDILCGMPFLPEPKRGTKRLLDGDDDGSVQAAAAPAASEPPRERRPRAGFSKYYMDQQWMDASLPRVDPKLLQLLQHLAYSADLTTIDLVEDLMVYYLQGRGIARYTYRKSGTTLMKRRRPDRTKKQRRYPRGLPHRKLPRHMHSRFSGEDQPRP